SPTPLDVLAASAPASLRRPTRNTTRALAAAGRSVGDVPTARADSQASGRELLEPAYGERRINSSGVPRLPRQLRWPRDAGRACHRASHPRVRPRPEMYLGSAL